ncbi:DJ-1/PfpI family protein [Beijerinckia sp. L45]|uniref:DJ-1/PfpI family protein n=1 Tax=Beijerinckia sp. L45 TaxID=1641855 RepID=UPI00131C5926|nr:DJ-1/PfpI family protein [Beijerinckia sp. L45]
MTLQIGLLLFPDIQQLDLTAPYEVFASLPGTSVHLVAKTLEPVRSVTGLTLQPTMTLADCPKLDVICVPGGLGINALLRDDVILAFLREQAETARYITSVCTGALVLGAAGLLVGKRATTHWGVHDLLARFGAIPTEGRVVRDGAILTGGGVTAGIDFALTLATELMGDEAAQIVQLSLEYAPAPPFDAGRPETAPPAVLAATLAKIAPSRRERETLIDSIVGAPA